MVAAFFGLMPFTLFALARFPEPKHAQGFPLAQAASVIKSPVLWLCGALLFFQSGNEFTVGGWITSFLEEVSALTPRAASFLLTAYWGAMFVGITGAAILGDGLADPEQVMPLMAKRKSGHIFNISSVAGKQTYENGAVYCASKKAVEAIIDG